jgi:hypothetical protein
VGHSLTRRFATPADLFPSRGLYPVPRATRTPRNFGVCPSFLSPRANPNRPIRNFSNAECPELRASTASAGRFCTTAVHFSRRFLERGCGTTRVSLSASGATPQAVARATGVGKKGLEKWNDTRRRCVYVVYSVQGQRRPAAVPAQRPTQRSQLLLRGMCVVITATSRSHA